MRNLAKELRIFRSALHAAARDIAAGKQLPDWVFRQENAIVDYYISCEVYNLLRKMTRQEIEEVVGRKDDDASDR